MMTKNSTHVAHDISISRAAFEKVVETIARLSLERAKFVKFKEVMLAAIEMYDAMPTGSLERFAGIEQLTVIKGFTCG